jgi:hypothetical protein
VKVDAGVATAVAVGMPGPPSAPVNVMAWASDMSWEAPAHDGGLPVTGYLIRAFDESTRTYREFVVEADQSNYWFSQFPGGSVIGRASVEAFNAAGSGELVDVDTAPPGDPYAATATFHGSYAFQYQGDATIGQPAATEVGDFQIMVLIGDVDTSMLTDWTLVAEQAWNGMSVVVASRTVPDLNDLNGPAMLANNVTFLMFSYAAAPVVTFHWGTGTDTYTPAFPTTATLLQVSGMEQDPDVPSMAFELAELDSPISTPAPVVAGAGGDEPVDGWAVHRRFAPAADIDVPCFAFTLAFE